MNVARRFARLAARALLAGVLGTVLAADLRPAAVEAQIAPSPIPPPPPNPLAPLPLPLAANPIPKPNDLAAYVKDEAAAVRLGKALFWDMQAGGDGVQSCGTCHFHAGADSRVRNQLNPGTNGGASHFEVTGPNGVVTAGNFPFHRYANPDDDASPIIFDSDDVMSSQGVFNTAFVDVIPGSPEDRCDHPSDPIWNVGGTTVRRVEPRNTPTMINAIFNFRNFWDGRAAFLFNGVNPVGPRDPDARVFEVQPDTSVLPVAVRIDNGSLASQATGPPLSGFEMSCAGRTFPKLGKKMLSLPPLAKQLVAPSDGVLGSVAQSALTPGARGLAVSYARMIQDAFQPRWWDSTKVVTFPGGVPTVSDPTGAALTTDQFTVMEANFSLFWGLAIQLYEATLVSGEAPFDRFVAGDGSALTLQQQQGLEIFLDECSVCHGGSLFSNATIPQIGVMGPGIEAEFLIERMHMELGIQLSTLTFLRPPVGVPPVFPLDFEPRGVPVDIIPNGGTCADPAAFSGTIPGTPGSCAQVAPAPVVLAPTGLLTLEAAVAAANFAVAEACLQTLTVALLSAPLGDYTLCVAGVARGTIPVLPVGGKSSGAITFETPPPPPLPVAQVLDFDPRGSFLAISQGTSCSDPAVFAAPFPGAPVTCDPNVPQDIARVFNTTLSLPPTGAVPLGPFPLADATLDVLPDCSATFALQLLGVPGGQYTICTDGVAQGTMTVLAEAFYDHGFYNIGVRPTPEDLGIGGEAMGPIAFVRRLQLGLPVPELSGIQPLPAIGPGSRIAADGAFKVPGLRNVSLTAPYMHNGGMGTLLHVVEMYTRGADFFLANIDNLDPEVAGIGSLRGNFGGKTAVTAFLESLTDDRVRFEKAPFDHPGLFVPNGHPGTTTLVHDDGTGKARDVMLEVAAVGATGSCIGVDGTRDTAPRPCPAVEATVEADVSVQQASAGTNFGTSPELQVDASTAKSVFVRVRVSGVGSRTVTNARLRLKVGTQSGASSNSGGRIRRITSCSWDEFQMTWNTKPLLDGALLDAKGAVAAGQLVDFDVTAAMLGDGVYCFAIDSLSSDNVIYNSREAAAGKPELLLAVAGACDCAVTPSAGCGDGRVNTLSEECDGAADAACPGLCRPDCTCTPPVCGDNLVDRATEQCDGTDDARCPGFCRADCTCAPIPPTGVVLADAYVSSASHATNFGTSLALNVRAGSTVQQTFVRVRVVGLGAQAASSARLRLKVAAAKNSNSVSGGRIHQIADCSWNEGTITWDTRPTIDPGILSTLGAVARNQILEFDVTGAIPGDGVYCFAIDSLSADSAVYNSREAATGKPEFLVALGPGGPPSTTTTTTSTTTTTLPPPPGAVGQVVADVATAADQPATNLGTAVQINADAGPTVKHTFLRIQVSGVGAKTVTSANLTLRVASTTNAQSVSGGSIHAISDCAWNENAVTFNAEPLIDGAPLSTLGAVALNQTVQFDVTSAIPGDGTYCFAIDR